MNDELLKMLPMSEIDADIHNSLHLIPTAKKPLMNIGLFVKLLMVV